MRLPRWSKLVAGYIALWAAGLIPHAVQWEFKGLLETALWLALALGFFGFGAVVLPWTSGKSLRQIGFGWHLGYRKNLILGILCGVGLTAANYGIRWSLGVISIDGVLPFSLALKAASWALLNSLYSAAWEETLNRGYVMQVLPRSLPPALLALVSALIFTGFHVTRWGAPVQTWVFWFFSGLLLVIPYLLTRSLWFSTGLHWGQNFLVFALFERGGILETSWATGYPWFWNFTNTAVLLAMLPLVWWLSRWVLARGPSEGNGTTSAA